MRILGKAIQPTLLALAGAGLLLLPLIACASGGGDTTPTTVATDESGSKVVVSESPAGSEPPPAGDDTAAGATATTDPSATDPSVTGQQVPGAPAAASADAEVLGVLRTVNALEVKAAELATQKATSPQVRQFAQALATDHQRSLQKIDTTTSVKPLPGVLSNAIDQQVGAAIDRLESTTGPQFDREFMQTQVALHQQVAQLISVQLLPVTQNPEVRQLAESMHHAVAQHLQQAQQIAAGLQTGP